jgi:uncharacterized membrane protein
MACHERRKRQRSVMRAAPAGVDQRYAGAGGGGVAGVVCRVLACLLFAIWLYAASFMVLVWTPITDGVAMGTVDTQTSGLSRDYLVQIARDTRLYCLHAGSEGLPLGADERRAYPPQVIAHLNDVGTVFMGVELVFVIDTVALVLAMVIARARRARKARAAKAVPRIAKQQAWRWLAPVFIAGSIVALALVAAIILAGVINFEALFTAMHEVFFAQGNWMFSADSLLICALPQAFWMYSGLCWGALLVVLAAAGIVVGVLLRKQR